MGWFFKSTEPKKEPKIRVSHFLNERAISIFSAGPSKQQVLGQLLASLDLTDPSAALKAILAREEAGSTVVSPGFALPHARIPGLAKLQAALAICPAGVIDPRAHSEPIKFYLLFLGRSENMKEHLGFLSAVSTLFQNPAFLDQLVTVTTPADALRLIRDAESAK